MDVTQYDYLDFSFFEVLKKAFYIYNYLQNYGFYDFRLKQNSISNSQCHTAACHYGTDDFFRTVQKYICKKS